MLRKTREILLNKVIITKSNTTTEIFINETAQKLILQ